MKRLGVSWFLILIIIIGFSSSTPGFSLDKKNSIQRTIITVDDEPGDANFISIYEALNYSNPGDIIEVYSGIYYEHNIIIDKAEVTLKGIPYELGNGNDTGKPFIKGNALSDVITIRTHNVTITGFHIENGIGSWAVSVIYFSDNGKAEGCIISNNDLSYSPMPVIYCTSNYCKIINNNISYSSSGQGILLRKPCDYTIISGNVISYCKEGIYIGDAGSRYTITENIISQCDCGIVLLGDFNIVSYNTMENNYKGLHVEFGNFNRIEKNNFINNTKQASFEDFANIWSKNYWGQPRLLPYPIFGICYLIIPWVQFDWHPAQKPYDIPILMD
jgi:parallel beta-helix repeat protein